jgi:hypothetical protein
LRCIVRPAGHVVYVQNPRRPSVVESSSPLGRQAPISRSPGTYEWRR